MLSFTPIPTAAPAPILLGLRLKLLLLLYHQHQHQIGNSSLLFHINVEEKARREPWLTGRICRRHISKAAASGGKQSRHRQASGFWWLVCCVIPHPLAVCYFKIRTCIDQQWPTFSQNYAVSEDGLLPGGRLGHFGRLLEKGYPHPWPVSVITEGYRL